MLNSHNINPEYMGPSSVLHMSSKHPTFLLNKTTRLDHLMLYLMYERI